MQNLIAALAWAAALSLCVPGLRGRHGLALAVLAAAGAVLHLPLAGTTPIAALRGLFGEPAPGTALVLCALLLARVRGGVFSGNERGVLAALAAATGLIFYPPALGLGPVDPYAWGYQPAALALAAGALALLGWAGGYRVLAAALVAGLIAWRLQLMDSPNLWDYLLDPLLALGGAVALLLSAAKSAYRAMRRPAAARSAAKASEAR